MSKESRFVPIEEVNSPKLIFAIPFSSYVPRERIGVAERDILRLMKWGGISELLVTGDEGERSRVGATVVGFNSNGEAVAGKVKSKSAPLFEAQKLNSETRSLPHSFIWTRGQIILNMDEVSSTIGEKQNVRSSEAWSREINRALKKGIPQIGTEHLIKDVSKPNLAMSLIWTSMGAWISSLWFINGGKPEYQAAVTAISIIAHHNFINFFARNFNFKGEDGMRFSFFNGPELDRALVLSVLSRTKTLAKEIKQIN